MGAALGNVILGHAAQINPDWVAAQMDELWSKNDPVAKDNDTPGLTYYSAHSHRALGEVAWDYTFSAPLSRAFFNARTKQTTFVVFNPNEKAQSILVYKSGKKIGTLSVPPREMISTQQLGK
jgi:hypothetical protein